MDHDSHSSPSTTESEHVIRQHNILSQNVGTLFNTGLYSDLVLIVGEERFEVHKALLVTQSAYFRSMLTNGMSETSKREITIHDEQNVSSFGKLLQYVYSGEVKFDGADDAIEMLIMANKYVFGELQQSIETHLAGVLSLVNFFKIYSTAFTCSASNLIAKCLSMADSKASEILEWSGFCTLEMDAVHEIIRRESFSPLPAELFVAVSKWIAVNNGTDGSKLLSNIRLQEMSMNFLLHTVRPSKFFTDDQILNAMSISSKKGPKEAEIGNSTPFLIDVWLINRKGYMKKVTLPHQYQFDTIARVKVEIMVHYNNMDHAPVSYGSDGPTIDYGSISLWYKGIRLQFDQTLESYGIRDGDELFARCE